MACPERSNAISELHDHIKYASFQNGKEEWGRKRQEEILYLMLDKAGKQKNEKQIMDCQQSKFNTQKVYKDKNYPEVTHSRKYYSITWITD